MSSTDKIPNMEHSPDRQTSPTVLYSNELGMGEDMVRIVPADSPEFQIGKGTMGNGLNNSNNSNSNSNSNSNNNNNNNSNNNNSSSTNSSNSNSNINNHNNSYSNVNGGSEGKEVEGNESSHNNTINNSNNANTITNTNTNTNINTTSNNNNNNINNTNNNNIHNNNGKNTTLNYQQQQQQQQQQTQHGYGHAQPPSGSQYPPVQHSLHTPSHPSHYQHHPQQYQQQFHFRVQHQSHQHSLQQHVMLHLQKQQDIQIQQGKERTMDGKLPHTPHTSSTPRQNTEKTTTVSKVNDKLDENKEKGSSGAVTMATTHTKLPTNQSSSPVLNNIPNIISQNSIFQHVNNVNPSSNTDQSLVRVAQRMTSSPIATGSPTTTLTPSIQSPTGAESQNQSIVNTSRDATTTPAPNSPITVNSSPIITSQIYTQSIAGSQPHTLPHTLPKSTPDDKNIKHTTTTTTILQDAVLSGVLSGMPPPRTTTAQFVATNYTTLAQQAQAASQGSLPPRSASGRLPPPTRRAGNSSSSHLGFRKITFPGVASGGGGITSTEISGKTSLIGGNLGNSGNSSNTQRFTLPSIGFMGGMLTTSYTNQQRGYGGGSGKIETGMPPTITPSQTQKHAQLPKPPPVSNPIAVNITGQNSNPPINVAVGHVGNSHSGKGGVGTGNEGQMTYMSSIISLVTGSSMSGRMSGTPSTHQTTTTASHSGVLADQMMKKTQQHLKRKREDGTAIDMNDLCLHSKKPCLQRKIDGYDYCMRHVMEDNHRFTLQSQASKKSKQSDQHLEQHRKNSRKRTNPSDTGRRPERRLGPAATPQERLERRIKLGIALQQHHIALGSEFIDPPLDGDESSSLSDEDSRQIETDVEGEGEIPYQWWVKGYNLGNNEEEEEDEDYLRAAGVFTEEELLERRRQKLLQLKDLYLNQYRRLGASLEDHQNMHLSNRNHFFKANNISLSHTGLPFEPAHEDARVIEHVEETDRDNEKVKDALELKEEALEARRRFVRRYRKRHGVEGHMHTLVLNRNKGSQSLCVFMDDGVRCTNNVMSLAKYCFNHILCDPKQVLFKPCAYQLQSGAQCSQPILAWHRVRHCDTHMGAEDFPRLARNTMQAGHKHKRKQSTSDSGPASPPISIKTEVVSDTLIGEAKLDQ